MRGTLTDQDLSEVNEQEYHDTSFCYKSPLVELSDSPSVSKNRTAKITMSLSNVKGKGMVIYSAVSSPLDRSTRFTLSSTGRPVHPDTVLGFSWKHSSHAAIAQRLFTHMSTTVYSQVLIYKAVSTEAS